MKKKIILLSIMVFVIVISVGITKILTNNGSKSQDTIKVVTSFYPVYVATANIVDGIDEIELENLTQNQGSCLHDYQITTNDMKMLEDADVFIMNGAGMESFVDDILNTYPNIYIIDTSKGISLLESETEHDHSHDEVEDQEDEEDHQYNGHVWLNPDNYLKQLENIQKGLSEYSKANAKKLIDNEVKYSKKILDLKDELKNKLANPIQSEVIIFHDSFAYLAKELGLEVVYTINLDGDTSLSAGDVAQVIDEVNLHEIKVMFSEAQFSDSIPQSIAKETQAKVYVIDSLVSGLDNKDAYINGMKKNIEVLEEALFK
jgi:zinc transport system substrate-binding protein